MTGSTIRSILPFIVLLQTLTAFGQNLVPNPSFEDFSTCPGNYTQNPLEFRVKDWKSASLGTPDYFNMCSNGEADVPYNWAGVSDPYEGKGYAGLYVWMNATKDYREYLQCQLLEPLLQDSVYEIEFHYKLSSYSKFSIDRMGLLLSNELVNIKNDQVLSIAPTLSVVQDSALTIETGYWETARLEYHAKGGEQFLVIGNFFDNTTTRSYSIQFRPASQMMLANSAYYYIDDVRVIPQYKLRQLMKEQVPEFIAAQTELNTTYILKNIQFEFNSYRLHPSSFRELDFLVGWLEEHPGVIVRLFGHTDDVGSEKYNLTLSRNRAKTVAAYLISQGIGERRIESGGYGKTKPLAEGTTEEARSINRRVEVKFVK